MELCCKDGIVPGLRVFVMKEIITLGKRKKKTGLNKVVSSPQTQEEIR